METFSWLITSRFPRLLEEKFAKIFFITKKDLFINISSVLFQRKKLYSQKSYKSKYHFPREINEWTDFYLTTDLSIFQEPSRRAICENVNGYKRKKIFFITWKLNEKISHTLILRLLILFRELQENLVAKISHTFHFPIINISRTLI